jgi:hypothetical protein
LLVAQVVVAVVEIIRHLELVALHPLQVKATLVATDMHS